MTLLREKLAPLPATADRSVATEIIQQPPSFDVLIVGGGVAGLIQATVLLQEAHKRGITVKIGIIEKGIPGENAFLKAKISSNSQGKEFIDFIDEDGPLASVLETQSAQDLRAADTSVVNLSLARQFYVDLGQKLQIHEGVRFIQSEASEVWYDSTHERHIAISSQSREIIPLGQARHIVFATGAQELPQTVGYSPIASYAEKIIVSSEVESEQHIDEIRNRLLAIPYENRKGAIAILGNSYSAWASALKLIEELGDIIPEGGIVLAHRGHGTKLFYETIDEAQTAGYFDTPPTDEQLALVDTNKGRVNRFDGIRDGQRDLVIDVLSGKERRIRIVEYEADEPPQEVHRHFEHADILIQATGLSANVVAEYSAIGLTQLVPPLDYSGPKIQTSSDGSLDAPNSYGIGLGYDTIDASEIGGRRGFALHAANIYSGFVAPRIAETILNDLQEQIFAKRRRERGELFYATESEY